MSDHPRERKRCLEILGLPEDASEADIKKAYRNRAREVHPDKNRSDDATEKFQEVQAAYKYLIEGPSILERDNVDADIFVHIFARMFPWIFTGFGDPFGYAYSESDSDDDYVWSPHFGYRRSASPPFRAPPSTHRAASGGRSSYKPAPRKAEPAGPPSKGQKKRMAKLRKRQEKQRAAEEAAKKKMEEGSEDIGSTQNQVDTDSKEQEAEDAHPLPAEEPVRAPPPQPSSSGPELRSEAPASGVEPEQQPKQAGLMKKSSKQQQRQEEWRLQKEREKVGEELQEHLQREREKRAKKEAARKEKEEREAEERRQREEEEIAEEARRFQEEIRLKEEEEAKKRQEEEEKREMERLFADFDKDLYLDGLGDFITKETSGIGGLKTPEPFHSVEAYPEEDVYGERPVNRGRGGRGTPNNRGRGNGRYPRGQGRGGYQPPPHNFQSNQNGGRQGGGLLPTPPDFEGRGGHHPPHNPPNGQPPLPHCNDRRFEEQGYPAYGNDQGRYGPPDYNYRGGRSRGNPQGRGQGGRGDRGRGGRGATRGFGGSGPNGDMYQDGQSQPGNPNHPSGSGASSPRAEQRQPSQNASPQDGFAGRGRPEEPRSQGHDGCRQPDQRPQNFPHGQPTFNVPFVGGGAPPRPQGPTPPRPLRPLSANLKGSSNVRNPGPPLADRFPPPGFNSYAPSFQEPSHGAGDSPANPTFHPGAQPRPQPPLVPGFAPPPMGHAGGFSSQQFAVPRPGFAPQPRFGLQAQFVSQPQPSVPIMPGLGGPGGLRGQRPYIPPFGSMQRNNASRSQPAASEAERVAHERGYERTKSRGHHQGAPVRMDVGPQGGYPPASNGGESYPPAGYGGERYPPFSYGGGSCRPPSSFGGESYPPASYGGDTYGLDDIDD